MTIATHARDLYGRAPILKSPRDLEYDVFARITGRLRSALAEAGGRITAALAGALHENRELWTVLALDLAHPDNALPGELRARLIGLAGFTLRTTERVLFGNGEAGVLVEINMAVLRGLRGVEGP